MLFMYGMVLEQAGRMIWIHWRLAIVLSLNIKALKAVAMAAPWTSDSGWEFRDVPQLLLEPFYGCPGPHGKEPGNISITGWFLGLMIRVNKGESEH